MSDNRVGRPDETNASTGSIFFLEVEKNDKFAVLTNSQRKSLMTQGEAVESNSSQIGAPDIWNRQFGDFVVCAARWRAVGEGRASDRREIGRCEGRDFMRMMHRERRLTHAVASERYKRLGT